MRKFKDWRHGELEAKQKNIVLRKNYTIMYQNLRHLTILGGEKSKTYQFTKK